VEVEDMLAGRCPLGISAGEVAVNNLVREIPQWGAYLIKGLMMTFLLCLGVLEALVPFSRLLLFEGGYYVECWDVDSLEGGGIIKFKIWLGVCVFFLLGGIKYLENSSLLNSCPTMRLAWPNN
jgi:hypothetical protein